MSLPLSWGWPKTAALIHWAAEQEKVKRLGWGWPKTAALIHYRPAHPRAGGRLGMAENRCSHTLWLRLYCHSKSAGDGRKPLL